MTKTPQSADVPMKLTRHEIEEARAHLKAWFPNQSAERHMFNKICDHAVIAARSMQQGTVGQTVDFEKLWQGSRLSYSSAEIYKADIEDIVRVALAQSATGSTIPVPKELLVELRRLILFAEYTQEAYARRRDAVKAANQIQDLIGTADRCLQGEATAPVYIVNGKPHRECDCPKLEGKCRLGGERRLLTTQLSRCLIPE